MDEPISRPILDARIEAEKLRTKYANNPRQNSFRVLVTGESGTGKTHLLRTARKPVHVDSFDPGGTLVLRDLITLGDVIADTEYETEDRTQPTMFREWCRTFESRVRSKYFESIATYALDSSTLWADAIISWIQGKDKRAGEAPNFYRDYNPQKIEIQNWMHRILALPCDIVVTGHLEGEYDDKVVGEDVRRDLQRYRYMTTGKGAIIIPLMFDEQWTTVVKQTSEGAQYQILTSHWGYYRGRTRIGRGKFAQFEKPDVKALLKKAGWSTADKPKLF